MSAVEVGLPSVDPRIALSVGRLADGLGVGTLSPSEIMARSACMHSLKAPVLDGLKFFSSVLAVLKPTTAVTVATADAIAKTALFAKSIPLKLDNFLDFDRATLAGVLTEGLQRLKGISVAEESLRRKFNLTGDHEWPSVHELRSLLEVGTASGLRRIAFAINGRGAVLFPTVELDFVWPGSTFTGFEERL